AFARRTGIGDLSLVTPRDVERYVVEVLGSRKEAARLFLTFMEQAARWAGRNDVAEACRSLRRRIRVYEYERRRGYVPAELLPRLVAVLKRAAASWSRRGDAALALLLMLQTGARLGEALSVEAGSLRQRGDALFIEVRAKGGRVVVKEVADPDTARLLLSRASRRSGRLLLASPQTVDRWFKRFLLDAGASAELASRLRPHDLRRTAAMLGYEATRDLDAVRVWLGHSRPDTTIIYLGSGIKEVMARKVSEVTRSVVEALSAGSDKGGRGAG
ncbi:MAG: tyrosine-type recombinase/integrase, partial [Conexivisphaera sp.]